MPQSQPMPASPTEITPSEVSGEELRNHRGHWVAFSADGTRLIASCATLKELETHLRATGENPEEVLLDRIPDGDAILSGSELS
jgi:hypothetical protein